MKKIILIVIISVLLLFGVLQTAMIIDTIDFMKHANYVFSHEVVRDDSPWWGFGILESESSYDYSYTLTRRFTWHNFREGFIRVYWQVVIKDPVTGEIVQKYGNLETWSIKKVDGAWELVGRDFRP